jgi:ferredoxin
VAASPASVPREVAGSDELVAAPPAQAAPAPEEAVAAGDFEVSFKKSGKTVKTDGQATLLELAEVNGIEIDNACRTGSCLTCKVHVASGDVACDEGELDEGERKQGYVLSCVTRPRGKSVAIDV